ncbi:thermosome subunit [Candidatus Woesearchaeota archaeon CG07_land_8_20_14_0_80_44_23]|nr:MAG: thermosome subunit [Candidatus Woesearchaeota archaeon CG07_land_8_20_14_0_80_44_23]
MAQPQIQPIFILPEGSQRTTGKNAQHANIMAAMQVAATVRTTLGPKGMDKMLVDTMGDVIVTNDGVTILEEIEIEHPIAKMMVEIAKTQEDEVGDGTTTAVVLAGELLKRAENLLDQGIHPTVIAKGYRIAAEKSQEILSKIGITVTENDSGILQNIAVTAMTGKGAEYAKDKLGRIAVDAVKKIASKEENNVVINKDNIKIEKKVGAGVDDTELIDGIVLDKEKVHSGMPSSVKNAKILLLDSALEIKNTETEAKIQITDPEKMQTFLDMEEKMIRNLVDKVVKTGANVIFCQKGIDDIAQHLLAKKGIYAARRVSKSDMEKLELATGGKTLTILDDFSPKDLGFAGLVEEKKTGDESMTYVMECKNAKAVTILIRGGSEHVISEIKRAMEDSIGDIAASINVGKVVGGAGAVEAELAKQLRKFADSLSGREQLAVQAFADSIEVIPRTLAENAGLDPIDILTEIKAAHDKGEKWAGIDVFSGKIIDAVKEGIIEPLKIKTQAIKSASEVSIMILRIDDIIASSSSGKGPSQMPPGGMGGMPEY